MLVSKVKAAMTRLPIPQGTLDMLMLQVVSLEPLHGYAIAQRLQHISRATVQVHQGSLCPPLHRLELKGRLRGAWRQSDKGGTPSSTRSPGPARNSWRSRRKAGRG